MTSLEKVELLSRYFDMQCSVALLMALAHQAHDDGNEVLMFSNLFEWQMLKDERANIWGQLQGHYTHAIVIAEGIDL